MLTKSDTIPDGWLAFELNVLRRLKFTSIIFPFTPDPQLGAYLKRWNARVLANDPTQSAWIKAVGLIQNNGEKLSDEDLELVLEDVYIPQYRLQNESLKNWFTETDAWWFDNVRQNIEKLSSPLARAIALSVGISVGDYVLSFGEETRQLRQPLSNVYKRLLSIQPETFNNGQNNLCQNKSANEFVAENSSDSMFLRLPPAHDQKHNSRFYAWSEEWLRGGNQFWNDLETAQNDKLGTFTETKSQYLRLVEEFLRTASHIPTWSIEHIENGFVSTQEIVETISRIRRVDTIFSKDFSELIGAKAVIITA
jgi:adenine-specific DNA methylase